MESAEAGFVCRPQSKRPPIPLDVERLVALAEVWSFVRFAHPWLAARQVNWHDALVAAIPRASAASTEREFVAALDEMLRSLGDPATAVNASPAPEASTSTTPSHHEGDALVVDVRAIGSPWDPVVRGAVAQAIEHAEQIVFDLRDVPSDGSTGLALMFEGWNPWLVRDNVTLPTTRWRVLHGFPAEGGRTSGGYYEAFETRAAAVVEPRDGNVGPRVAFVTGRSQVLPPIALPLRERGRAVIVSTSALDERAMAYTTLREVRGVGTIRVRTRDVVYRGGTPVLEADVLSTEDPITAAVAALRALPTAETLATSRLHTATTPSRPSPEPDELPGVAHRIASAIDLWSTIEVFHAYPELRTRWAGALPEAIVEVREAQDWPSYLRGLMRLLAKTDDGHSRLSGDHVLDLVGRAFPPFRPSFVEGCLVVAEILEPELAGELQVGDVIVKVDDVPVSWRYHDLAPFVAASTPNAHRNRLAWQVLMGPASRVMLEVERAGKRVHVDVRRWSDPSWPQPAGLPYRRDETGAVGLVDLRHLKVEHVAPMFEALADTEAIIFDMRGYPQGTAWTIAPYLDADPAPTPAALFLKPLVEAGHVDPSRRLRFMVSLPEANVPRYSGRTVMLIDERAISQAEYTGMFFTAANNTLLVGSPTAGANGDVTSHVLPDGLVLSFTGQAVAFPDGHALQRVGLRPDVHAQPTIDGIREGRDELTDAALVALGVKSNGDAGR